MSECFRGFTVVAGSFKRSRRRFGRGREIYGGGCDDRARNGGAPHAGCEILASRSLRTLRFPRTRETMPLGPRRLSLLGTRGGGRTASAQAVAAGASTFSPPLLQRTATCHRGWAWTRYAEKCGGG